MVLYSKRGRMIKLKIGARTFKTGLAILLSFIIPPLFGLEDSIGLTAAAVIFSMQPSVQETFVKTRDRLVANIIGGLLAFVVVSYLGDSIFLIAVASAMLISLLHQLGLNDVIGLSTLTLINVMLSPGESILITAIQRVAATLTGIMIAFFVNTFVLPPRYDVKFYNKTVDLTDSTMKHVRQMLRKNAQFPLMAEDLKRLNKEVITLRKFQKYMRDAFYKRFASRKYYSMLRFLVLCRQSIKTNQVFYDLAVIMHESESTLNHLPNDLRTLIRERMETLMTAHEQILLKWNGRILPEEVNFLKYRTDLRRRFMEAFYTEASSDASMEYDFSKGNDLLRLMTKIFEYDKELQHFNKLTNSFVRSERDDHIKGL